MMKRFYIRVLNSSDSRGYNRTVKVYKQNKDGSFCCIAEDNKINTASYRGDKAIANSLLHEKYGFKWDKNHKYYSLMSKDIKLIFLP
jgi:hypothetical protein